MKNNLFTIILIIVLMGAFVAIGYFIFSSQNPSKLVSSVTGSINQKPSPTPTPTPIIYNFNSSTDLKSELDSINPEILDTDFADLKKITSNL